jgi:hypothetical protein
MSFLAVIGTNVMEKSSSESDKEINVKEKRLRLRSIKKISESNAFLNVLKNIKPNTSLKPLVKETTSISDETVQRIYGDKEDSSNSSSAANILKLRSNILKKKEDGWVRDQGTLQNILTKNIILNDSATEELSTLERSNPSNLSTSKMQNNISDNNTISNINKTIQNNESDVRQEILKPKSRLINIYAQKNRETNVFEDTIVKSKDLNLSKLNLNQETNIHDAKESLINLSSKINKSINEINISHKKSIVTRRSPKKRSSSNIFKRKSLNTSIQNNEQNVNNLSLNDHEFVKMSSVDSILKLKSKQKSFIHLSNKNLSNNQFKKVFEENDVSSNENNAAILINNNSHISVKQKKITAKTKQIHGSSTMIKHSKPSSLQLNNRNLMLSQVFMDTEKMKKIKDELERIKNRERTMIKANINNKESILRAKCTDNMTEKTKKAKLLANSMKIACVDKAFVVNGEVYKAPRLPRPKHWVTDRLYKFLWKYMEPKYKLMTRVQSEKFVQELAKIVTLIQRRKKYNDYKIELEILMKEMARLRIIRTRNDFYIFCQDFLPFEFRIKVIPMLLPGNKRNIPYNPNELHVPLLSLCNK